MKILIFGSTGQIGSALLKSLRNNHNIVIPNLNKLNFKLINKNKIKHYIESINADLYINAAAFTDVDATENYKKESLKINFFFVKYLVEYLKVVRKPLIHFSTDYVYGNSENKPLIESSNLNPINFYGYTKLMSEKIIIENLDFYFIFRISWIYSNIRNNFFLKILNIFENKESIKVINDQYGSPTPAWFVSDKISHIINSGYLDKLNSGVYNLSPSGYSTWFNFAEKILVYYNSYKEKKITIVPTLTKDFESKALRQTNSRLNCNKFKKSFHLNLENWDDLFVKHTNIFHEFKL